VTEPSIPYGVCVRISRARRSGGKVETLGVDRQLPPCRALVAQLGGYVVEECIYIRNDTSGYSGTFPFPDAVADLRSGKIRGVVAWQADRFTRRVAHAIPLLDAIRETGGMIATVAGPIDLATGQGRATFRDMASRAELASDLQSERLILKHDELASAGAWPGGQAPYGYCLKKVEKDGATYTTLERDPVTAPLVVEAVNRVLRGETTGRVLADWNRRGVLSPKGKRWAATPLRKILTSPAIAGLRQHHGEVVGKAMWEPIIDRGQHERLRALFGDKAKRRRAGRGRVYLLSGGLAICGSCTRPLYSARRSGGVAVYACVTHMGGCGGVQVRAADLEHLITEGTIIALSGPKLALLLAQQEDVETGRLAQELDNADKHLEALATRHGQGEFDMAEWLAARAPVAARRDQLRARLREAPTAELLLDLPRTEKELRQVWEVRSVDWRRARVALVLNHVTIRSAKLVGRSLEARVDPDWRV
jgi:site-specific DNA recombinase